MSNSKTKKQKKILLEFIENYSDNNISKQNKKYSLRKKTESSFYYNLQQKLFDLTSMKIKKNIYYEKNLLKGLAWIKNNLSSSEKYIHIVTHSRLISAFLKKCNIVKLDGKNVHLMNNSILKIITKDGYTFFISRHLLTCSNMLEETKVKDLCLKALEKDTNGSLNGIFNTLLYKSSKAFLNVREVYVSCLIRTWQTALFTYVPLSKNNELILRVTPFIKEHDLLNMTNIDSGNFPLKPGLQVLRLKSVIEKLHKIFKLMKKTDSPLYIALQTFYQNLSNMKIKICFGYSLKPYFTLTWSNNKLSILTAIMKKKVTYGYETDFEKVNDIQDFERKITTVKNENENGTFFHNEEEKKFTESYNSEKEQTTFLKNVENIIVYEGNPKPEKKDTLYLQDGFCFYNDAEEKLF